jgi:hypothetical protein
MEDLDIHPLLAPGPCHWQSTFHRLTISATTLDRSVALDATRRRIDLTTLAAPLPASGDQPLDHRSTARPAASTARAGGSGGARDQQREGSWRRYMGSPGDALGDTREGSSKFLFRERSDVCYPKK